MVIERFKFARPLLSRMKIWPAVEMDAIGLLYAFSHKGEMDKKGGDSIGGVQHDGFAHQLTGIDCFSSSRLIFALKTVEHLNVTALRGESPISSPLSSKTKVQDPFSFGRFHKAMRAAYHFSGFPETSCGRFQNQNISRDGRRVWPSGGPDH